MLGAELIGVAIPVARTLGISLIALDVACWPGRMALCGKLTWRRKKLVKLIETR